MGGVTINVQVPVSDDRFPSTDGRLRRVYIPSGIQHMTGAEALRYARSRHGSNDFDRGVRQQRVLLSLREQADPQALIPRLPELDQGAREGGLDRHPGQPARAAPRARLGDRHEEHPLVRLHAAVLPEGIPVQPARLHHRPQRRPGSGPPSRTPSPPTRPTRRPARRSPRRRPGCGSSTAPATATAGRASPATSTTTAWPHRRRARSRRARSRPTRRSSPTTAPRRSYPATIAYLEKTFGVTVTTATDPAIRTDIIVTVGKATPDLEAPPLS